MGAFADLLRKEMVAPHASVVSINPDLPLGVCDPVGYRGVDPVKILSLRLQSGEYLCRWKKQRPSEPAKAQKSDVRICIRFGDVEWNSKVTEQCPSTITFPEASEAAQGFLCCLLTCSGSQVLRIDIYDDARIVGEEERHLGTFSSSVDELLALVHGDSVVTLTPMQSKTACPKNKYPRLKLEIQSNNMGPESDVIGIAPVVLESGATPRERQAHAVQSISRNTPLAGALGVRIGGVSVAGHEEVGSVSCRVLVAGGRYHRDSRSSEPHSWVSPPKLRLPVREHRIVEKLRAKDWNIQDIAELIERPTEMVRNELDPEVADQHAEAEREAKAKLLDSWYINDMVWLEVPHAAEGEDQGSQRIRFELRDSNKEIVAAAELSLLEAAQWPWLKWLDCPSPSALNEEVAMAVQLLFRFRPAVSEFP
jgi:hypothetical protein